MPVAQEGQRTELNVQSAGYVVVKLAVSFLGLDACAKVILSSQKSLLSLSRNHLLDRASAPARATSTSFMFPTLKCSRILMVRDGFSSFEF